MSPHGKSSSGHRTASGNSASGNDGEDDPLKELRSQLFSLSFWSPLLFLVHAHGVFDVTCACLCSCVHFLPFPLRFSFSCVRVSCSKRMREQRENRRKSESDRIGESFMGEKFNAILSSHHQLELFPKSCFGELPTISCVRSRALCLSLFFPHAV